MSIEQLETVLDNLQSDPTLLIKDPEYPTRIQDALLCLKSHITAPEALTWPLLQLGPKLGWVPRYGADLAAAPHLIQVAATTTDSALALSTVMTPVAVRAGETQLGLRGLVPALVDEVTSTCITMERAEIPLELAPEARSRIPVDAQSPTMQSLLQRFDRCQPLVRSAVTLLGVIPELAGDEGPRTYLVLAKNSHELRATGGFVSSVGRVTLDGGEITGLSFQDSYSVDDLTHPHPPAPGPLRRLMGAGMLVLRDANWWPDFPTSAQAAADLYLQDQGRKVDGVIALDLEALRLLLQALGPVEVPDYDQEVNSEDLESLVMTYWEAPQVTAPGEAPVDGWLHRKDFNSDFASALSLEAMGSVTVESVFWLVHSLGTALEQRHLLIYAYEREAQSVLQAMRWDGGVRSSACDS